MPNPIARTIAVQAAAGDVTFNLELDSNAASAPSSYITGWQTAANLLSAAIHIPITVNLEIGYTEFPKDNSPEPNNVASAYIGTPVFESYQQLRSLLLSNGSSAVDAAVNALPNTTSLNGQTTFQIASAEAKAWGLVSATNTAIDGYAGFGTGWTSSDIVAGALHEFTHAMGRIPGVSVLSLFRYTSPGQHDFDPNLPTAPSYFSINGGNTDLADFGQQSDPSDFLNPPNSNRSPNDPFNEIVGTTQTLTSLDLTVLAMLGFSGSTSPTTDDYANSLTDTTHPFGQVSVGGSATGTLETAGDRDWFAIQLSAGVSYTINLQGQHSGGGTLSDPYLRLHNSAGTLLAQDDDIATGNPDSQLTYQATTTGTYYIEAGAHNDALTGTYRVSAAAATAVPDDYANSLTDTTHPFGQVSVGASASGTLEVAGDRDWFRVQLSAGTAYTISLLGQQSGSGTLTDPYLRFHDSTGALLAQDDDIVPTVDLDSQLTYTPTASGTYYIEAGAFGDASTGIYRVTVDTGLTNIAESSGATFSTHGTTLFTGSQSADTWTGTASATISSGDSWNALAGTMAEEIASSVNLSGSSSLFTNPTLLGLNAPYGNGGLAVSGAGPATANETISYNFSAPVAAGNSFILWAPGAFFNSETGPFTFTVSASLGGTAVQTSGWSLDLESPFGTALPGNFTVSAQTGTVTVSNYSSNPFATVIITPNAPIDHISVAAQTIENDLWGFAFSNAGAPLSPPPNGPGFPDLLGDGRADLLMVDTRTGQLDVDEVANAQVKYLQPGALSSQWNFEGFGNFLGDGKEGTLFWNSQTGSLGVIEAGTGGSFKLLGGSVGSTWRFEGTGDYLNENQTGFVIENSISGAVQVIEGGNVNGTAFGSVSSIWQIEGSGNYRGDGKTGLLLVNTQTGALQDDQGGGGSTSIGSLPSGNWAVEGTGNFFGNGKDDVLLLNVTTSELDVGEVTNGTMQFTDIGILPAGRQIVGVGNYDGNSTAEFMQFEASTGHLILGSVANGAVSSQIVGTVGSQWDFHSSNVALMS